MEARLKRAAEQRMRERDVTLLMGQACQVSWIECFVFWCSACRGPDPHAKGLFQVSFVRVKSLSDRG